MWIKREHSKYTPPMKLTPILLRGALIGASLFLCSCAAVESVARTTKNVLGIPKTQQESPMAFGGVRNEYHAALERRKADAILEILGERSAQ